MSTLTYKGSGVDQNKADNILENFSKFQASRPKDPHVLGGIGPYAACYSLKPFISGMEDPVMVTSCDGVGTKVKLALDWNQLEGLGHDLVAMNVNDLLCMGAKPLVFLDYYACGKLDATQLTTLLKSIQSACELAECTLVGGETAEMPGVYQDKDFDLAGFVVGVVDKNKILGPQKVKVGQKLIGIASSGPHSNGYSLIRKIVEKENLKPDTKTPFSSQTWKEVLLAPTLIYTKVLKDIFPDVCGLAHITGGGLLENLPRILPANTKAKIHSQKWKMPALYEWALQSTGMKKEELLSTFNCGYGMIIACESQKTSSLIASIEKHGMSCNELGEVAEATQTEPFVEWL